VSDLLGGEKINRFVVSTHTMALATSLGRLAERLSEHSDAATQSQLAALDGMANDVERAVLPASLARSLHRLTPDAARVMRALPALLEKARDEKDDAMVKRICDLFDHRPETYYALIQMDGDRMGAWMAGNEPDYQRCFADSWHPQVRTAVQQKFGHEPRLLEYMRSLRPASPARHAAISAVLNDFSTHVARHVVEEVFKGKLLYAGGDDVLAMVSVDDLLPCMLLLRAAYSGVGEWGELPGVNDLRGLALGSGYVGLGMNSNARLLPMMGRDATASIGAVVAHHQSPLGTVMRELRKAEKQAKGHRNGGRNAFCLRVMKRGGGEVGVTSRFWDQALVKALAKEDQHLPLDQTALGLMLRFAATLAQSDMSRRAVYNTTEWLAALPSRPIQRDHQAAMTDDEWQGMVTMNLAMQFKRQSGLPEQAAEFVKLACAESEPGKTLEVLEGMLVTAEFFAREGRFLREGDR
jgi:CRISPR-associated protein Cmr2